MEKTILSLGSNLGDREYHLRMAREQIAIRVGEIAQASPVRETEAWGFAAAPFLNQVLVVHTELSPWLLLEKLKDIEKELGRSHKTHYVNGKAIYSDRTIDIDILYYGDCQIDTETLTIPHPRIEEREFILEGLRDLGSC